MTIAKLIVELDANLGGLQRNLRRSQQFVDQFTRHVQREMNASNLFAGLGRRGLGGLQQFTQGILRDFDATARQIRARLSSNLIDPAQATRDLRRAQAGMLREIQNAFGAHPIGQELTRIFTAAGVEAGRGFNRSFAEQVGRIGQGLSQVGTQLTRSVTIPLLGAGAAFVKFAAEAEIARTRLDVVVGPAGAQRMVDTLRELQGTIPASTREVHNFAASFGEMLIPLKIAPARAQEMSVALIEIAKNIALVQKVPAERAFSALRSALVSQTRELRKLGVNVTELDIKREAFGRGWLKAGEQIGVTARAMAAFNVIVARSALLSKANETASQTFALRLLFLKARAEDAGAALGRELLPVLIPLIEAATRLAVRLQQLGTEKIKLILKVGALIAVVGPLLAIIGNLVIVMQGLVAVFIALGGPTVIAALALLAAVAAIIYEIKRASREAAEQMNAFRESVADVSEEMAGQMLTGIDQQIQHFQGIIDQLKQAGATPRSEFQGETFVTVTGITREQQLQIDQAQETLDILKEQRRVVDERRKSLERQRKDEEFFQQKLSQFRASLSEPPIGADPFKQLKEDVDAAIRRMQIVEEAVGATGKAMRDPLERALELYDDILLKVEQYGGFHKAPSDLLQLQLRLLKQIDDILAKRELERFFPGMTAQIRAAAEQVRVAQQFVEIATRRGTGIAAAEGQREAAQRQLGTIQQTLLDQMNAMGLSAADQVRLWNQVKLILQEIGVNLGETTEKVDRLNQFLRDITTAARGVLNLADAFGEVSDKLRNIVQGITGMAEGIVQVRENLARVRAARQAGKSASITDILGMAGGIIGIIGGAASLLQGVFGKSDEERQREQERAGILRENNQRLSDLVASMRGLTGEISNLIEARHALEFTQSPGFVQAANIIGPTFLTSRFLARFGITLQDLDRIAEEVGITIRDSAGKIVPEALLTLYDALLLAAEAATRFHDNLEHRRRRLELRADIEDAEDTPVARINRELQLLEEFGLPIFEQFFAGIDTTTAEGQAQLEAALRALFDALENGTLPLEAFGRLNLDELLDIIMGVEGALDALREQANDLTDALKNVPTGFKVALARFDATAAQVASALSGGPTGAGRDVLGGGGIRFPESRPLPPITIEHMSIDARDRPIADVFEEIKQIARDESRRTTGSTTHPFRNIA